MIFLIFSNTPPRGKYLKFRAFIFSTYVIKLSDVFCMIVSARALLLPLLRNPPISKLMAFKLYIDLLFFNHVP